MNGRKAANWLRRNFHAAAAALCLVLLIAAAVWGRGKFAKGGGFCGCTFWQIRTAPRTRR